MKAFIALTLFVAVSALPPNIRLGQISGPEAQLRHWEPEPPAPEPNEENEVPPVISPSSILDAILEELARSHNEDSEDRQQKVSLEDIVNALNILQEILQNHGGAEQSPDDEDPQDEGEDPESDDEAESEEEESENENVSSESLPSSNGSAPIEQNESTSENQGVESGNAGNDSEVLVEVVRREAPIQSFDILSEVEKSQKDSDDIEERISLEDIVNALNILKEIIRNHGGGEELPSDDEPQGVEEGSESNESDSEEESPGNEDATQPSLSTRPPSVEPNALHIENQIPKIAGGSIQQGEGLVVQSDLNRPIRVPFHALPQDMYNLRLAQ